MKKRLIPFRWLPASWGLTGTYYEEAEAHYYYEGYELDHRIAEIFLMGDELAARKLEIDLLYEEITERDYDFGMAELSPEAERPVKVLETKIKYGEIDPTEGEKQIATLLGEPWIKVINDGLDQEEGVNGYYFEFDWNDIWIERLKEAGYAGPNEEAIVQVWFQDVCRAEASASMGVPPINGGVVF